MAQDFEVSSRIGCLKKKLKTKTNTATVSSRIGCLKTATLKTVVPQFVSSRIGCLKTILRCGFPVPRS